MAEGIPGNSMMFEHINILFKLLGECFYVGRLYGILPVCTSKATRIGLESSTCTMRPCAIYFSVVSQ